ncbi:hypothetical protein EMCRGX_G010758 [Ephydatia muelleri]|eukprot:Em0006g1521a
MPVKKQDALRALEVLEDCRRRSAAVGDKALTETLNKAIVALRSKLFVALLDVHEFYVSSIEASTSQNAPPLEPASSEPQDTPTAPLDTPTAPQTQDTTDFFSNRSPEPSVETIVLEKGGGGLGLSIAGGVDNPHIDGHPGIFITKILPDTVAELDGRLRLGDQILSVNGVSLEAVVHVKAVETLKLAGQRVTMVIKHSDGRFSPVFTLDRRTLHK